jgi:hypothetical protein
MGFCAGYDVPGYLNPGYNPCSRAEFGFARGMGRGNRWGFYATGLPGWARGPGRENVSYSPAPHRDFPQETNGRAEIRYLKNEAKRLTQMLEEINCRMEELSKTSNKWGVNRVE